MREPLPISVHLVRHGRVASHRGDVPVTPQGLTEVAAQGRRFAAMIESDEEIFIQQTSTRRARETADALYRVLVESLSEDIQIHPPKDEWAIRNPDLFIGGKRVEMVSTAQTMAEQIPDLNLNPEEIDRLPFYGTFFPSPDRVGYWLAHTSPPGENAVAVARRIMTYLQSLLDIPGARARRYICVTHSPILRAFLRGYLLPQDPGEPAWLESTDVTLQADGTVMVRFRDECRQVQLEV